MPSARLDRNVALTDKCPKCGSPKVSLKTNAIVQAYHWGSFWNIKRANVHDGERAYTCTKCHYQWETRPTERIVEDGEKA